MKYPNPLRQGSTIAITALSSGIAEKHDARFQVVKEYLQSQGFNVVVGDCLHGQEKHVSAPTEQRAEELMSFLLTMQQCNFVTRTKTPPTMVTFLYRGRKFRHLHFFSKD